MKKLLILVGISVNVLISQSIVSVDPNTAAQGASLWVTITGEETYFVVTDTVGAPSNVDAVMMTAGDVMISATSFTPTSRTVLSAHFDIPAAASIGSYDVTVDHGTVAGTDHPNVSLVNGFSVEATASLSQDIIPTKHLLHQNFPNPFNPSTNISFKIANSSNISLVIYDVSGNLVRELKNGFVPAGEYNLTWDGRSATGQSVASGLYIYQLQSNSYIATKKMLMIK
jgi:hypothetical protein